MPDRVLVACKVIAALGAATTVGILTVAPGERVAPIAPVVPPVRQAPPPVPDSSAEAAQVVVHTNVFAPSREAPPGRTYASRGDEPAAAGDVAYDPGLPADTTAPDAGSGVAPTEDPVPTLYGIVQGTAGDAALLRLDRAAKGGRLYRVGEGSGGWRVAAIGADRVTLATGEGTRIVRLAPPRGRAP